MADAQLAALKAQCAEKDAQIQALQVANELADTKAQLAQAQAQSAHAVQVHKPLDPFTGKGSTSNWDKWIKKAQRCFRVNKIPQSEWTGHIMALLEGDAVNFADNSNLKEEDEWEHIHAVMSLGPWRAKNTNFSSLHAFTNGSLARANQAEVVTSVEEAKAKSTVPIPDVFMVFFLLLNLNAAMRNQVLLSPQGVKWESYNGVRQLVLSKAAAEKAAGKSGSQQQQQNSGQPRNDRGAGRPSSAPRDRSNGRSTPRPSGAGHGNDNAGASTSTPTNKRKSGCFGCGDPDHRIGDLKPDGSNVCPKWNAQKAAAGKGHANTGGKRFAGGKK